MRPDTARHPALTLTLHRRPQRSKTYAVGSPSYEVTRGIARWLVDHFSQRLSVAYRPSTATGRSLMNVKIPAATNINVSFLPTLQVTNHQRLRQRKQYVSRASPR